MPIDEVTRMRGPRWTPSAPDARRTTQRCGRSMPACSSSRTRKGVPGAGKGTCTPLRDYVNDLTGGGSPVIVNGVPHPQIKQGPGTPKVSAPVRGKE